MQSIYPIKFFTITCEDCDVSIRLPVPPEKDNMYGFSDNFSKLKCPKCFKDLSDTAENIAGVISRYNIAVSDLGAIVKEDHQVSIET